MKQTIIDWIQADPNLLSHSTTGTSPAWMESARTTICGSPGFEDYQIAFTSGATEANRLALEFLYHRYMGSGLTDASFLRNKVLIFALEHSSIYEQAKYLRNLGYDVLLIPSTRTGLADVDFVRDNAGPDTVLVSMMYASGDTGVLQPVEVVGQICEEYGIHFHCDASQVPGKHAPSWYGSRANTIALSGHKFGSLAGVGALLYRRKPPVALLFGESKSVRPGMPNRLGIQSMSHAWSLAHESLAHRLASVRTFRDLFETELSRKIPGITFLGREENRLANTSAIILPGISPHRLLQELTQRGQELSIMHGSGGLHTPSRVLLELGTQGTDHTGITVSLGPATTSAEISGLIDTISLVAASRN